MQVNFFEGHCVEPIDGFIRYFRKNVSKKRLYSLFTIFLKNQ